MAEKWNWDDVSQKLINIQNNEIIEKMNAPYYRAELDMVVQMVSAINGMYELTSIEETLPYSIILCLKKYDKIISNCQESRLMSTSDDISKPLKKWINKTFEVVLVIHRSKMNDMNDDQTIIEIEKNYSKKNLILKIVDFVFTGVLTIIGILWAIDPNGNWEAIGFIISCLIKFIFEIIAALINKPEKLKEKIKFYNQEINAFSEYEKS